MSTFELCEECLLSNKQTPATYFCKECKPSVYLCVKHHKQIHSNFLTKSHLVTPLLIDRLPKTFNICLEHDSEFKTICYDCNCLCCFECTLFKHKKHKMEKIALVDPKKMKVKEVNPKRLQMATQSANKKVNFYQKEFSELLNEHKSLINKIHEKFDTYNEEIDEKEKKLIRQIEQFDQKNQPSPDLGHVDHLKLEKMNVIRKDYLVQGSLVSDQFVPLGGAVGIRLDLVNSEHRALYNVKSVVFDVKLILKKPTIEKQFKEELVSNEQWDFKLDEEFQDYDKFEDNEKYKLNEKTEKSIYLYNFEPHQTGSYKIQLFLNNELAGTIENKFLIYEHERWSSTKKGTYVQLNENTQQVSTNNSRDSQGGKETIHGQQDLTQGFHHFCIRIDSTQVNWYHIGVKSKNKNNRAWSHGYIYNPYHVLKSHNYNSSYGEKCQKDDIITIQIDMDNKVLSFFRNLTYLGVAFKNLPNEVSLCLDIYQNPVITLL
ncbi:hypothetical protein M0813_11893 [Anaeramoeba flamelloides]|uniref:B box-type domain-containing protein n=1 Tax=Anaeramoeba flamelloides TaxID=1746091 RepID=A0ABQ8ZDK6_9EUKA|nr:hypothetical protein M0813_11893 [Anaeramoeba flamelloides]